MQATGGPAPGAEAAADTPWERQRRIRRQLRAVEREAEAVQAVLDRLNAPAPAAADEDAWSDDEDAAEGTPAALHRGSDAADLEEEAATSAPDGEAAVRAYGLCCCMGIRLKSAAGGPA